MAVDTIAISELKRLLDAGHPLDLIDVRTPGEFAAVHVDGARPIPLNQLDPAAVAAARPSADTPIYVICQSGGRSARACELLRAAGVGPALSVAGGTAAWARAGLPVHRGTRPVMSIERQVRIGAGLLVVIGVILTVAVHRDFLAIPAFVGAGLVFAGLSDFCGMGLLLAKLPCNRPRRPNNDEPVPPGPPAHQSTTRQSLDSRT